MLGDDGSRTDKTAFTHHGVVHNDGTHSDGTVTLDGTSVDDCTVADCHIIPNDGGGVKAHMDAAALLDAAAVSHCDGGYIPVEYGVVPDAGVISQGDCAADYSPWCYICGWGNRL